MQNYFIAIDIGGTRVRAALFNPTSNIPEKIKKIQTSSPESPLETRLIDLIKSISPLHGKIVGIGIAVPGLFDSEEGKIVDTPNIKSLSGFPLKDFLQDELKTSVILGNDANLAALGEWKYGAAQGHRDVIYLTISTGIGSGIISSNHLITGSTGFAGELGHVTILPNGPICSCGKKGHLEALSSGTAIAKWFQDQVTDGVDTSFPLNVQITAKSIAKEAQKGDPLSLSSFKRAGFYIGLALSGFIHTFNPSIIVLGGGVMESKDLILEPIINTVMSEVYFPLYTENLIITTPQLGDDAGLMGAFYLTKSYIQGLD